MNRVEQFPKRRRKRKIAGRVTLEIVTPHNQAVFQEVWHELMQDEDRYMSWGTWTDFGVKAESDWSRVNFVVRCRDQAVGCAWIERVHTSDSCDINLGIREKWRDHRIGSYTARALLRFCFEKLGAHRVESWIVSANEPSMRLAKGGMKREGIHRDAVKIGGCYYDQVWFGILRNEWDKQIRERG
jgi:RimJ/RimL family protein N-acetyltransferase